MFLFHFVNDLPLVSNKASFTLFSKDTALTIHNKDIARTVTEAEMVVERVSVWSCEKKQTLNGNKTEYKDYRTKARKVRAQPIQLRMSGLVLCEVNSYKYLGSALDATLNRTQQLARLNQSLILKMRTFGKVRCYVSENMALQVYKSTILAIIDYSDILYGLLTKQQET